MPPKRVDGPKKKIAGGRRRESGRLYPGKNRNAQGINRAAGEGFACVARAIGPVLVRSPKMPGLHLPPRMPKPSPLTPASPDAPEAGPLPASYEAGLQELEQLVAELESGQLPLDRLLGSYQRGAALLAFCRERLQAVEDQIKVLDANGLKAWTAE